MRKKIPFPYEPSPHTKERRQFYIDIREGRLSEVIDCLDDTDYAADAARDVLTSFERHCPVHSEGELYRIIPRELLYLIEEHEFEKADLTRALEMLENEWKCVEMIPDYWNSTESIVGRLYNTSIGRIRKPWTAFDY